MSSGCASVAIKALQGKRACSIMGVQKEHQIQCVAEVQHLEPAALSSSTYARQTVSGLGVNSQIVWLQVSAELQRERGASYLRSWEGPLRCGEGLALLAGLLCLSLLSAGLSLSRSLHNSTSPCTCSLDCLLMYCFQTHLPHPLVHLNTLALVCSCPCSKAKSQQ